MYLLAVSPARRDGGAEMKTSTINSIFGVAGVLILAAVAFGIILAIF